MINVKKWTGKNKWINQNTLTTIDQLTEGNKHIVKIWFGEFGHEFEFKTEEDSNQFVELFN